MFEIVFKTPLTTRELHSPYRLAFHGFKLDGGKGRERGRGRRVAYSLASYIGIYLKKNSTFVLSIPAFPSY